MFIILIIYIIIKNKMINEYVLESCNNSFTKSNKSQNNHENSTPKKWVEIEYINANKNTNLNIDNSNDISITKRYDDSDTIEINNIDNNEIINDIKNEIFVDCNTFNIISVNSEDHITKISNDKYDIENIKNAINHNNENKKSQILHESNDVKSKHNRSYIINENKDLNTIKNKELQVLLSDNDLKSDLINSSSDFDNNDSKIEEEKNSNSNEYLNFIEKRENKNENDEYDSVYYLNEKKNNKDEKSSESKSNSSDDESIELNLKFPCFRVLDEYEYYNKKAFIDYNSQSSQFTDSDIDNKHINKEESMSNNEINIKHLILEAKSLGIEIINFEDIAINEEVIYKHRDKLKSGILDYKHKRKRVFCKIIKLKSNTTIIAVIRELKILKKFKNEKFMLKCYGISVNESSSKVIILYNLKKDLITLSEYIQNSDIFSEKNSILITRNLLKFLLKIHSLGTIHRDINENFIFIDNNFNVICFDFYNSINLEDTYDIIDSELKKRQFIKNFNQIHSQSVNKYSSNVQKSSLNNDSSNPNINKKKYSNILKDINQNINENESNSKSYIKDDEKNQKIIKTAFVKDKQYEKELVKKKGNFIRSNNVLNRIKSNSFNLIENLNNSVNNNVIGMKNDKLRTTKSLGPFNNSQRKQLGNFLFQSKTNAYNKNKQSNFLTNHFLNKKTYKTFKTNKVNDSSNDKYFSDHLKTKTYKSSNINENFSKNVDLFYTPKYVCMELSFTNPKIGWAQDIYSLCCTILFIFLNYKDYDESIFKILLYRIFNTESNIPNIPKFISPQISCILYKGFNKNPLKRPSINELITLFNILVFKDELYKDYANFRKNKDLKFSDKINQDSLDQVSFKSEKSKTKSSKKLNQNSFGSDLKLKNSNNSKSESSNSSSTSNYFIDSKMMKIQISDDQINNLALLKNICNDIYNDDIPNDVIIEQSEGNIAKMKLNLNNKDENYEDFEDIIVENDKNKDKKSNDKSSLENKIYFEFCPFHNQMYKIYFCDTCQEFYCEYCIQMTHRNHLFTNVKYFLQISKKILNENIRDIDDQFLDTNYQILYNLSKQFNEDYQNERNNILNNYDTIFDMVKELKKIQLENLSSSKQNYLKTQFNFLFKESHKMMKLYHEFYEVKSKYESLSTCFMNSFRNRRTYEKLKNNQLNLSIKTGISNNEKSKKERLDIQNELNNYNFVEISKKFDNFEILCDYFSKISNFLIEKSNELKTPGRYIFRIQNYTSEILQSIKAIEQNMISNKMQTFNYLGQDIISLSKEILSAIFYTENIISFYKGSFKLIKAKFEEKIKITKFLPGSANVHIRNLFFVSGGELGRVGTTICYFCNINEKVFYEFADFYYKKRYHRLINLKDKYLMALGGWESNTVEIVNIEEEDAVWEVFPPMLNYRSECACYLCDGKWLYVFGGWEYEKKECLFEVEMYEVFDSSDSMNIITNSNWQEIKVRFNKVYLQKYNMSVIPLIDDKTEFSEQILLLGGYDEEYNYSGSIIKITFSLKDGSISVSKDEYNQLPLKHDSVFWTENTFILMENSTEKDSVAVNLTTNNEIYMYFYKSEIIKVFSTS